MSMGGRKYFFCYISGSAALIYQTWITGRRYPRR